MIFLLFIALLAKTALADVGSGQGVSYAITGTGRITGVRVWDANSNVIHGFQFRYGHTWTDVVGREWDQKQEIELFDNEVIVAISGKYGHNIQSVVFTTSLGRSLFAGQPSGHSFNMYPENEKAELRFISGRFHGAITSFGAHWGVVTEPYGTNLLTNTTHE
ncbi:zymogen granule membrane protein 16-like isoform X2 [Syngnathus scovelli]|uniref:zymogen granule membrane protein 16-like isoform X2 n=1 Tax=Syngnathus scovelli TaxID=161590 RepID=UPI00210FAA85|nr:zymogen granule membrane protein 16-like isoform X2 [Syngnathus scovelli]XP_049606282.1 zymogen granule membrane protein 16-like isoform X2 [Syngnathus scovelli]